MAGMAPKLNMSAVPTMVITLFGSFFLTNFLYAKWADWRYPNNANSMAGLNALFISFLVCPLCALASGVLFNYWIKRKIAKDSDPDV
jgi:hypothetical protein